MTPPTITLSAHQQWALTIALELEDANYFTAADYLRQKHFPDLLWHERTGKPRTTHEGFINLFRVHHGSLPPTPAAQPTLVQPHIRPDQITS